ncbi:hypothetical protein [Telmatospirillum sp. J64-1]|uniref:hypothetical protein n=1 Tax=Telmatospirillum sp. J64-1 TaxID=2502183 RepID=UPI00115CC59B|nr:hypothetical protein [Telmatospirillum sp. J64-1]
MQGTEAGRRFDAAALDGLAGQPAFLAALSARLQAALAEGQDMPVRRVHVEAGPSDLCTRQDPVDLEGSVFDGPALARLRACAVSLLGASFLARREVAPILVVGTGALATALARAHAPNASGAEFLVWGRDEAKAAALAAAVGGRTVSDLAAAVGQAGRILVAAGTAAPLLQGTWLKAGTYVELAGANRPDLRSADDQAMRRAALFADARQAGLRRAGDLAQTLRKGVIAPDALRADLADLARGRHPGRQDGTQITFFLPVGTAFADHVAARMVMEWA